VRYLLDTNILVRLMFEEEPGHAVADQAVRTLLARKHVALLSPQGVREFWHVCTRSAEANGKGLEVLVVRKIVEELKTAFPLLEDKPGTFDIWLDLVTRLSITGAKTHDANHAAFATSHGIDGVLTFDSGDFNRFNAAGIRIIHPASVLNA